MKIIGTDFDIKFKMDYTVDHDKAYEREWFQVADNSWYTYDLGIFTDKRRCSLTIDYKNNDIIELKKYLIDNTNNVIAFQFDPGEEVFGCEIDYTSPINCYLNTPINRDSYNSLDWASLPINLVIDPSFIITYRSETAISSLLEVPWEEGIERGFNTNRSLFMPYTGVAMSTYDNVISRFVSLTLVLTRDEMIRTKLYLKNNRSNMLTMNNPYLNLNLDSNDVINFRVKSYTESRNSRNLYTLKMELLIND